MNGRERNWMSRSLEACECVEKWDPAGWHGINAPDIDIVVPRVQHSRWRECVQVVQWLRVSDAYTYCLQEIILFEGRSFIQGSCQLLQFLAQPFCISRRDVCNREDAEERWEESKCLDVNPLKGVGCIIKFICICKQLVKMRHNWTDWHYTGSIISILHIKPAEKQGPYGIGDNTNIGLWDE